MRRPIKDAIGDYFEGAENRLRPRTVKLFGGVPREAKTLEAAMGIEAQIKAVIASVRAR